MTLFVQFVVFKGCMAWSSWTGDCKECNSQYRQRVGKSQEGVFRIWSAKVYGGFLPLLYNFEKLYTRL